MAGQPLSGSLLLRPSESLLRILSELDIVRRVSIDKVGSLKGHFFKVGPTKFPLRKSDAVLAKVISVVYPFVAAEWDVEATFAVKPAKSVVSRPVKKIEECGSFVTVGLTVGQKFVEPSPVLVEQVLIIEHLKGCLESSLEPLVEVDHMRIYVVQECPFGHQAKGNS